MTESTKRGPGRPRKELNPEQQLQRQSVIDKMSVESQPEPTPVPPGPLVLEVRLGPPGQGKIIFSQRVYAHTIDQQAHQAVITGALHPLKEAQ